jgi:hypothetical protein
VRSGTTRRALVFRCTAKTSSPCVYLDRAAGTRRTTKSDIYRAPDRKRPAKKITHGNDRLSDLALALASESSS